jgi:ABC-type Fe3+ transport system permease subunit
MMEGTMKRAILVAIIATFIGTAIASCTTREVLSGAAGAGAGYIIGKETSDDDD